MKVNFLLKGVNNPTNIICRFKPTQKEDFTCAVGIWVNRNEWNLQKQQLKQKATTTNRDLINSKLNDLSSSIIDKWNLDVINKESISKDWLKQFVNGYFGRTADNERYKAYFVDWVQYYLDNASSLIYKGKPLTIRTIQKHKTTLSKLRAFETKMDKKYHFENIDLNFYMDFLNYCRTVEKLGNNTIGKYIQDIKKWCKYIELEKLPISQQYKHPEFVVLTNKTKDTYLNEMEIDKVFNYDFSAQPRLDNTRDLFILGLRTGLRVSDFLRLKEINMNKGFIEIETAKTGEPVIIPLHSQVQTILNKRNGALPHTISEQKFNEYIKEICNIVGINEMIDGAKMNPKTKRKEIGTYPKFELISSHTCRRSFASNLYGKLPNMVIMAITGHVTEAVFLKYIKITKKEHAETLKRFWATEQTEKGYSTILRVAE